MKNDAFVFVGGGSGGHLFPGLAVAESLRQMHPLADVVFFCSDRAIDREILEQAVLQIPSLRWESCVHFIRGGRLRRWVLGAWRLIANYRRLRRLLREIEPVAVVGLGAAASVAGCIAASNLQIPVILLEGNTIPGRATTALSPRALITFTGLPVRSECTADLQSHLQSVGVPVRRAVSELMGRGADRGTAAPRLLILGGSQGAQRLNRLVMKVLQGGVGLPENWEIVHQAGAGDLDAVRQFYVGLPWRVRVEPFLHAMDEELAAATLVISRAGAGALADLACARVASILVPLRPSVDEHQWSNAMYYEQAGAARVVDEQAAEAGVVLGEFLAALVQSEEQRVRLSEGMASVARPDAARRVAEYLVALASGTLQPPPEPADCDCGGCSKS